ncbi:MAG: adenylate cyclase [Verrucomicrobiota bacterium]|jgi:TolB-like protein/Tfp pilus assembly protein PilF
MSAEIKKKIELEIAHVLFIDIVGYSKLSINEQRAAIDELTQAVRASEQFQNAEAAARLIKIPTGDGMALVFYKSPEEPVECALEISRALKDRQLRMGVHSGPVSGVIDVNGQANLAGAGLNMAQRVMDCGDAGHILLSKRIADDLGEYEHWRPLLHDLGECEVKHGMRVSIVNLHADEVGNAQLPKKFQTVKKHRARMRAAATTAAVLALAIALLVVSKKSARSTSSVPEKSIAVLPFKNLSANEENAYFVDGLTEEILNRLVQISPLKVPGRTSSFVFKDQNRDLREIGAALGVAHVLEGSVRKSGERLRITAQLVRTSDGYHLWSQAYDRQLDDIFAIQEEIAGAIAKALSVQLKLGGEGKPERPTQDMAAYGEYLEARALIPQRNADNLRRATTLLETAVQRDPGFAKAWAALAQAHALGFYYVVVPIKQSLEGAENAARKALAIDDSLGAAHSALADVLRDRYDWLAAEAEYRRALELNPGEAETHNQYAHLLLRVGHLDAAFEHARRACELDPLAWVPPSIAALSQLARGDRAQSRVWLDRSEKALGKIDGYAIRYELMHALAGIDTDLARRALAMARASAAPELSSPADKQLIEALDQALGSTGNSSEPAPNLSRALTDAQARGELHVGSDVAMVAVYVNQPAVAVDALWSEVRPAGGDLTWIWTTPALRSLRHEQRFRELLKAMKLPEYWRAAGWPEFCRPKGANDFECLAAK